MDLDIVFFVHNISTCSVDKFNPKLTSEASNQRKIDNPCTTHKYIAWINSQFSYTTHDWVKKSVRSLRLLER